MLYWLAVYRGSWGVSGRQSDWLAGRNTVCPEKLVEHEIYVLNISFLKLLCYAHERGGVGMYKALVERRNFYQIQFHGG